MGRQAQNIGPLFAFGLDRVMKEILAHRATGTVGGGGIATRCLIRRHVVLSGRRVRADVHLGIVAQQIYTRKISLPHFPNVCEQNLSRDHTSALYQHTRQQTFGNFVTSLDRHSCNTYPVTFSRKFLIDPRPSQCSRFRF